MLDAIKKTLDPPYNSRDLYSIFVSLFLMLLIPLTVLESTKVTDNRSSAATIPNNPAINVSIVSPQKNDNVTGVVDVVIEASDENDTIASINLYANRQLLAEVKNPSTDNKFTAKVSLDSAKFVNGKQTLVAIAINQAGEQNTSETVTVTSANQDITPPTVSFKNLNDGEYLSGNSYLVKASASDDNGVSLVKVSVDNSVVKQFSKVPYNFSLDLTKLKPGNHTITIKATDFSGNQSSSQVGVYRGVKTITN